MYNSVDQLIADLVDLRNAAANSEADFMLRLIQIHDDVSLTSLWQTANGCTFKIFAEFLEHFEICTKRAFNRYWTLYRDLGEEPLRKYGSWAAEKLAQAKPGPVRARMVQSFEQYTKTNGAPPSKAAAARIAANAKASPTASGDLAGPVAPAVQKTKTDWEATAWDREKQIQILKNQIKLKDEKIAELEAEVDKLTKQVKRLKQRSGAARTSGRLAA